MNPLLAERNAQIARAVENGASRNETARQHGISRERAGKIVGRNHGRRLARAVHPQRLLDQVRLLWDEGLSQRAIARRLRVTPGMIAGIASRHGFPKRPIPENFRRP